MSRLRVGSQYQTALRFWVRSKPGTRVVLRKRIRNRCVRVSLVLDGPQVVDYCRLHAGRCMARSKGAPSPPPVLTPCPPP